LFGKGFTDGADLTMSTDMDTARAVFVSGDQQAGMQAFMAGKVRVQGDMTKLMMQQGQGGNPALTEALQSITA
jgi:putative sterol carrier protein